MVRMGQLNIHDGEGNRKKIIDFIIHFKKRHGGNDPAVRRIANETGIPFSTVNYHIGVMVESGMLCEFRDDETHVRIGWDVPRYEYVRSGA